MNELNIYDIFINDVFVLNYHGLLVFFQVCKTTEKSVFLVELGIKKYKKDGITLTKKLKPSKKPLIITENNTIRKTTYEVKPFKLDNILFIPIRIDWDVPIINLVEYPTFGIYFATPIKKYVGKYWKAKDNNYITKKENEIWTEKNIYIA